jgi:hypothetical protein
MGFLISTGTRPKPAKPWLLSESTGFSHSCSLGRPDPEFSYRGDWRMKNGISLYLRAERPDQELHVVAHQGNSADRLAHFEYRVSTTDQTVAGRQRLDITWDEFVPPEWEGDGTQRFDPGRAMGLAFAFNSPDGDETAGRIWVDDIGFLSK